MSTGSAGPTPAPGTCSRCSESGTTTRVCISSPANTTAVELCDHCLGCLRTYWKFFMIFGGKHR
jgi:hypothetical protein